jgi:putative SOS response-associated peptidase YedK
MCGRVRLSSDVSEIKLVFSIPPDRSTPNIAPSWNVAPTDPLPVVRYDARPASAACVMRWGLVPYWAKDLKVGFANINAAEGIEGKPAFREVFLRRAASFRSITSTSGRRPRPRSNSGTDFESAPLAEIFGGTE